MADDHTQRPYRNEFYGRAAPTAAPAPANDPLVELARLIGQNDFSEFGRDAQRRAAAQQQAPGYSSPPVAPDPRTAHADPAYGNGGAYRAEAGQPREQAPAPAQYDRQQYAAFAPGADVYRTGHDEQGFAEGEQRAGSYDHDRYFQDQQAQDVEHDDIYDEPPRPRRRMGLFAVIAVFLLAVIGTAGAFGYRAIFGPSRSSGPPPVIKADAAPSKVVPPSTNAPSTKLSYDRVGATAQNEKLVSREEQPVEMKDKQAGVIFPAQQPPTMGSGVVGDEPKKIRTIAIRPEDVGGVPSSAAVSPTPSPASSRVTMVTPRAAPAPRAEPEPAPAPRQAATRQAPPVQQAVAAPAGNAPLSLSPNNEAPAPAARAPAPRTASAPARATPQPAQPALASGGNGGGYAVQVSSQRSESEAQAAFHGLQGKYPGQLGGKQPLIHRVDLGAKGIYYRAMVGPFANSAEAGEMCSSLKSAGGQCIVTRN